MSRWLEILEDSTKQISTYRLCFLIGVIGLFTLATFQFFGVGSIPLELYGILATMASGGYIAGKYNDRLEVDTVDSAELPTSEYIND